MEQETIAEKGNTPQVQSESALGESRAKSPDILWLISSDSEDGETQTVPRPDTPMPDPKKSCPSKYLKRRVKLCSGLFDTKFMRNHGPHGRVGLIIEPLNVRG
ncbi:hypothetical protein QAD02_020320 [Eretmocerus hayati]|uniref:Uncharacterized protein n=1 Tax=Eretmocerus hayati TaxID=131215 RepID=A0ACC2PN53_9HYME|nr:hypothetical protein QAD02_020320 [Eretmocerus hayati]